MAAVESVTKGHGSLAMQPTTNLSLTKRLGPFVGTIAQKAICLSTSGRQYREFSWSRSSSVRLTRQTQLSHDVVLAVMADPEGNQREASVAATISSREQGGSLPLPQVRRVIDTLLPGWTDVEAFCILYAPDVARKFAPAMLRTQLVNLLLQSVPWSELEPALRQHCGRKLDVALGAAPSDGSLPPRDGQFAPWRLLSILFAASTLALLVVLLCTRGGPSSTARNGGAAMLPNPPPGLEPTADASVSHPTPDGAPLQRSFQPLPVPKLPPRRGGTPSAVVHTRVELTVEARDGEPVRVRTADGQLLKQVQASELLVGSDGQRYRDQATARFSALQVVEGAIYIVECGSEPSIRRRLRIEMKPGKDKYVESCQ